MTTGTNAFVGLEIADHVAVVGVQGGVFRDVEIVAVLGASDMKISQLLKMGRGAVVQLDRHVGDEIEVYANKQLIARGEVVVVEDKLGVNLTKIFKSNILEILSSFGGIGKMGHKT